MNISSNTIIKEVVKMNIKTATLFQANNIDYCYGGNMAISEACKEAGIDADELVQQLEVLVALEDPDSEYINNLGVEELCNYIVMRHHAHIRRNIPILTTNLETFSEKHGDNHPELFEIRELFSELVNDLTMHMQKEEIMLFPFIRRLAIAGKRRGAVVKAPFGSLSKPIKMMMMELQNQENRFAEIQRLTSNYIPPEDACATYEVTLRQLRDFEDDLHRHIHLEIHVLFPKALEMENVKM